MLTPIGDQKGNGGLSLWTLGHLGSLPNTLALSSFFHPQRSPGKNDDALVISLVFLPWELDDEKKCGQIRHCSLSGWWVPRLGLLPFDLVNLIYPLSHFLPSSPGPFSALWCLASRFLAPLPLWRRQNEIKHGIEGKCWGLGEDLSPVFSKCT